jgi:hypothetical protein
MADAASVGNLAAADGKAADAAGAGGAAADGGKESVRKTFNYPLVKVRCFFLASGRAGSVGLAWQGARPGRHPRPPSLTYPLASAPKALPCTHITSLRQGSFAT